MGRALALTAFASLLIAAGCLSSSQTEPGNGGGSDASAADAGSPFTGGGSVSVEGGVAPSVDGGGAGAHAGFSVLAGSVRASSSAHVVVTTTGQAPGGNVPMHSAGHTIVGGIVGGTQKP